MYLDCFQVGLGKFDMAIASVSLLFNRECSYNFSPLLVELLLLEYPGNEFREPGIPYNSSLLPLLNLLKGHCHGVTCAESQQTLGRRVDK